MFYKVPPAERKTVKGPNGKKIEYEYHYTPSCIPNGLVESGDNDGLCAGSIQACESRGGGALFRVARREVGSEETPRTIGEVCLRPGDAVSLADLRAQILADYRKHVPVAQPELKVQPVAGRVPVNLPAILYAEGVPQGQRQVSFRHPLSSGGSVPVTMTVSPTWEWDFGDGTDVISTDHPGQPYTSGVAVTEGTHPYVAHTYRRTGVRTATVTVHWGGTFTVAGFGPFALPDIGFSDSATIEVREAQAVLTGNR